MPNGALRPHLRRDSAEKLRVEHRECGRLRAVDDDAPQSVSITRIQAERVADRIGVGAVRAADRKGYRPSLHHDSEAGASGGI